MVLSDENRKELEGYRKRIDEIDAMLLKLFAERMDTAAEIGEFKRRNSLPVYDPKREQEKLIAATEKMPEELRSKSVLLLKLLFELSRSHQYEITRAQGGLESRISDAVRDSIKVLPEFAPVACQGVEGTNSQYACMKLFRNPNIMYFSSFEAVFGAIEKGLCRYGIVPVENSFAGTVNTVYDLMMKHRFYIVRSARMKINHSLLANPGTKTDDIREVYSHPQALMQCSDFLSTLRGVRQIPFENTALAAKYVSESGRSDVASLSNPECARYYGLECLKQNAENKANNYTRFICISRDLEILPGANRTSLMVTLPHEQGSLFKLLSKFYALGINLLKLESRPIPEREFEFMFYFDLDVPADAPEFLKLISELPYACESFTYLGSYIEVV
ncbi:MAG: chorismate mutase [Clostridia bacterium]|nr:chorismate mutase [Clostridia bacterium]